MFRQCSNVRTFDQITTPSLKLKTSQDLNVGRRRDVCSWSRLWDACASTCTYRPWRSAHGALAVHNFVASSFVLLLLCGQAGC